MLPDVLLDQIVGRSYLQFDLETGEGYEPFGYNSKFIIAANHYILRMRLSRGNLSMMPPRQIGLAVRKKVIVSYSFWLQFKAVQKQNRLNAPIEVFDLTLDDHLENVPPRAQSSGLGPGSSKETAINVDTDSDDTEEQPARKRVRVHVAGTNPDARWE